MARRSARIKSKVVPVKGNWDVLPHGMGVLPTLVSQPANSITPNGQPSSVKPIAKDVQVNQSEIKNSKSETPAPQPEAISATILDSSAEVPGCNLEDSHQVPSEDTIPAASPEVAQIIKEEVEHLDGALTLRRSKRIHAQVKVDEHGTAEKQAPPKKRKHVDVQVKIEAKVEVEAEVKDEAKAAAASEALPKKPKRIPRKTKDNPYGLMPGRSPFPDWQAPSAAQCEEVYQMLAEVHGDVNFKQPATIPAPSLEVAGCGEVPFVLEALLRTLLSGAVTFDGADHMVKAIIAKYGIIQDELAKGSIDWNKVRLSTVEELEQTIHIGGLAKVKAKAIKGTLDMVYQDNIDRRNAYLVEKATGVPATIYGASEKTQGQKDLEMLKTDRNILSLDHLHGLSADEAMRQFTKFPGIGVKTAACVILFCLQRPCFAVDTHVHRFSRWLGWAPPKADENDTFFHLEVRCPDPFKYGLHQLFIHHGKQCGRCKMSTVEGTKDWEAVVCPLEHLLVRAKKMTKVQKKAKVDKTGDVVPVDESDSELSDLDEALFEEM
ncbi:DNA glycosylase [Astrocystis sublimbata]|nr:DNA glycosylase [Astrocystis sublimbata]